jgi:hypothetical protein
LQEAVLLKMSAAVENLMFPPLKSAADCIQKRSVAQRRHVGRTTVRSRGTVCSITKPRRTAPACESPSEIKAADVVQAMVADADAVQTQLKGCQTLQWLASQRAPRSNVRDSSLAQQDVVFAGGLDAVLKAMEMHIESHALQCAGVSALEKMTAGQEKSTMHLGSSGGIQTILEAMRRHPEEEKLQEKGCKILLNATVCNAELQAHVVEAGGIQTLLQAMQDHHLVPSVQEVGCRTLKEQAAYNASTQEEIFTSGGIQVVLRAMETHATVASIQVLGCGVLRNMTACSAEHQQAVVERGGIQVVVDGMMSHLSTANVQWAGCWALFCLAVHNSETQMEVADHGAARLAVDALEKHSTDPKVQEACCWLVKELAPQLHKEDSDRTSFMVCVKAVLHLMGSASPAVQTAAGSALRQLSKHDTEGWVKTTCLGRCGRLGRSTTMQALEAIKESEE